MKSFKKLYLMVSLLLTLLLLSSCSADKGITEDDHDISRSTTTIEEMDTKIDGIIPVEVDKAPEYNNDYTQKIDYEIITPSKSSEVLEDRSGYHTFNAKNLDFRNYGTKTKKATFIGMLLPVIDVVEAELNLQREFVTNLKGKELSSEDKTFLNDLYDKYKVSDNSIDTLLKKMIIPPKSLIISQAALESGWGTSRFFREGNNIFGVWSFDPNEPRIPAKQARSNGKRAYLKSYEDIKGSVYDYVLLLSKSGNYSKLRNGIRNGESSTKLTYYLNSYSEQGSHYGKLLRSVISANNLQQYD